MNNIEEIANNYVNSLGEILPGFKYGYANSREFTSKYYFDFIFIQMNGVIPKEPPVAGGNCGFTIDKNTFEIENLSFGELGRLAVKQSELNEAYEKIKNIKDNNASLHWLKSKYKLNSKQLLDIKKTIDTTEFEKETVLEHINKIIKTITNNV